MATEIEYKFLLLNEDWRLLVERSTWMRQGYLMSDARCSVRVRIAEDQGFLNIKSGTLGIERQEYEYGIPSTEAEELLNTLCAKPLLEKTRHYLHIGEHLWEIDEFAGANAGLIVAEIELKRVDEMFIRPSWLGADVSNNRRYYNSELAKYPYRDWQ